MPRVVDTEARREQIISAAVRLLGEGGFVKLTLSGLARELGGSMRLVTHYFRDRQELIRALLDEGLSQTDELKLELENIQDPADRLRHTLEWFLPLDQRSLQLEKVRVALVVHKDVEPVIGQFFAGVDSAMRQALRDAVAPFVEESEVEKLVDVLRAWTSGVALSSVEHPEVWTPQRQREVLAEFLSRFSFAARLCL